MSFALGRVMSMIYRVKEEIIRTSWSAAACALIAIAIYAKEGDRIAAAGGVDLPHLVALYFAIAVVSGTILGVLKPLAKGKLGAALLSIPVAWPVTFSIMLLSRAGRLGDLDVIDYGGSVVLACIAGPLGTAYLHIRRHSSGRKNP